MKIYCEADSCRWCVDGECGLRTIHMTWMSEWAVCEDYEDVKEVEESDED